MAFPAEGVEAAYRNNIDEVARLLKQNHDSHFLLFNLSNREYDFAKFNSQVLSSSSSPHDLRKNLSGERKNLPQTPR